MWFSKPLPMQVKSERIDRLKRLFLSFDFFLYDYDLYLLKIIYNRVQFY